MKGVDGKKNIISDLDSAGLFCLKFDHSIIVLSKFYVFVDQQIHSNPLFYGSVG